MLHRPKPSRSCRLSINLKAKMSCGFPAIGVGTRMRGIFSGLVASGAISRPGGPGSLVTGIRSARSINGYPATGRKQSRPRFPTFPNPRAASKPAPACPPPDRHRSGCPATGCITRMAMPGAPDTGPLRAKTGFMFRGITSGPRAVTSSSMAIGTMRSQDGAWFLLRFISTARSMLQRAITTRQPP